MYNLDYLKKISDNDTAFIEEILTTFVEGGIELLEAMSTMYPVKEKHEQLSRIVHKFIPGLNFVGVSLLGDDLNQLEFLLLKDEEPEKTEEILERSKNNLTKVINQIKLDFKL